MNISEALRTSDLRGLVKDVFEVDNYKSKIGNDRDICVLTFIVDSKDPAEDLENFIEMGYDFVLDAECTSGEMDDGKYRVFVEIERGRHLGKQLEELIDGVSKLTDVDDFRFRYHKEFKSVPATLEEFEKKIPNDPDQYDVVVQSPGMNNFQEFFINSYVDDVKLLGETLTFKRVYKDLLEFKVVDFGEKHDIYEGMKGPIMLEGNGMAETIYLTKYIGDFNINKIGEQFVLEKAGYALILEKTNGRF
jgi:hypothetical protein